jgi:hypothetical protein
MRKTLCRGVPRGDKVYPPPRLRGRSLASGAACVDMLAALTRVADGGEKLRYGTGPGCMAAVYSLTANTNGGETQGFVN